MDLVHGSGGGKGGSNQGGKKPVRTGQIQNLKVEV